MRKNVLIHNIIKNTYIHIVLLAESRLYWLLKEINAIGLNSTSSCVV